ncbi:hypothetical protein KAR91_52245 [Candidatus Pacearchaeota archaeon]|nr:hypothetical protein [Candidatus Pacearchaeota archaeon]
MKHIEETSPFTIEQYQILVKRIYYQTPEVKLLNDISKPKLNRFIESLKKLLGIEN